MKVKMLVLITSIVLLFAVSVIPTIAQTPVGAIEIWPGGTVPDGWLPCWGWEYSRTEYAELYGVIGTSYGVGDGSTTFNVPNLVGRFVVGSNPAATFPYISTGSIGGEYTHTLTIAEMPSHWHEFDYMQAQSGSGAYVARPYPYGTPWGVGSHPTGGDQAFDLLPPYMGLDFIIYAGGLTSTTTTVVAQAILTSTYAVSLSLGTFGDDTTVSITRTMPTTETEHYNGTITLPGFYNSFDPFYTIAMFMVFVLVGAAARKPTMFIIAFLALYLTGVLQRGNTFITYPIIILSAALIVYRFLNAARQSGTSDIIQGD